MPQLTAKDLNAYAKKLAAGESALADTLQNVISRVLELKAALADAKVQAAIDAIAKELADVRAAIKALAETLAAMGAHPDNSLPPPVEPTPEPTPTS